MFDEKMKSVWQQQQIKIGSEKLFPAISYSNLDQETYVVVVQTLDAMMRFVGPAYSHKAWSRHFQFNKFLGSKINRTFALRDRRFGKLAALCLIGLHHLNDLIKFLDSIPECRNQLACICRGMADLEEYLKFNWAVAGLLGIHLFEPYLGLIIDKNTPHSQLLKVFPAFHSEMKKPSEDFCQIEKPALVSIKSGWRSPSSSDSPFPKDAIESLKQYLEEADNDLIQASVKDHLMKIAKGFEDQKGSAYGFGEDNDVDHPDHVTQQAPSLEILDRFLTHSKPIENKFGHMDNLLNAFTPYGFEKACQTMVISSAKKLIFDGTHSWKKLSTSIKSDMKVIENNWTEE